MKCRRSCQDCEEGGLNTQREAHDEKSLLANNPNRFVNLDIQATDQLMDRGTGRILLEKDLKKWNEKLKDHEKCFIPYALTFFAASD